MNDLPTELWLKIIRSACLDDGSTGRALSAVSRRIRAISHDYRYQSMAVAGLRQVQHLIDVLRHSHNVGCRVEALFVEADDTNLIIQLCSIVAQTVEILTIVAADPPLDLSNLPTDCPIDLDFPRLREFTVYGQFELSRGNTFAPILERLEMQWGVAFNNIPFIDLSAVNHPNLMYTLIHHNMSLPGGGTFPPMLRLLTAMALRVFKSQHAVSSSPQRTVALEYVPMLASQDVWGDMEGHHAEWMQQQESKRHSHFVFLPEVTRSDGLAHQRWLDRVEGKGGVWALVEANVRDNVDRAGDGAASWNI
ncbi:hypothetical protein BDW22DRAFT_1032262 [Trametopsis cervina]|nr:hypothetical protein BDW22DRAFT_1032262 [Trametopsis cervina]